MVLLYAIFYDPYYHQDFKKNSIHITILWFMFWGIEENWCRREFKAETRHQLK